eukprot:TRINITY_DN7556_c0_g1_i1.p1 TRINITY_DN7556_c0_g1~~TRINITY_DN7556_c0_g1_i1.p1  ORF type:complete len:268 (+),score=49.47 TRINITY_DN7556_c0_g1_i1:674-1477(+)
MTKLNIYTLNPTTEKELYLPLITKEFEEEFPNFKLAPVLESFSVLKKLGDHVSRLEAPLQREFVEVVTWLLRRGMLIQIHTYIYLMFPESVSQKVDPEPSPRHSQKPQLSFPPIHDSGGGSENGAVAASADDTQRSPSPGIPESASSEDLSEVSGDHSGSVNDEGLAESTEGRNDLSHSLKKSRSGPLPPKADGSGSTTGHRNSYSGRSSPPPRYEYSPNQLSDAQSKFLKQFNDRSSSYKLFMRIFPYFNGKFHLEEIMWRENIAR